MSVLIYSRSLALTMNSLLKLVFFAKLVADRRGRYFVSMNVTYENDLPLHMY